MDARSDFLYARPSVWEGIARILDFGNTLNEYNSSDSPDAIALGMDWAMVGDDLARAIRGYVKEVQVQEG